MRITSLFAVPALMGLSLAVAALQPPRVAAAEDHDHSFGMQKQETVEKTFPLPAGAQNALEIDNVFGSIEITGGASGRIEVEVNTSYRADSEAALERARREVTLDMTQDGGTVKLYVDGPFRCHHGDDKSCCEWNGDRGYSVKMDFKVRVPAQTDLEARTMNEGRVQIRNVAGRFLVRNVNGGIEMDSVAGSGSARTVNGPVTVSFRENPRENSEFKTVNGNVELRFAAGLSAEFRMKTFNGGIYSDFPVTALPVRAAAEEHEGGKVIFRADRFVGARIGSGGPQIQVENLNGDIRILENHE